MPKIYMTSSRADVKEFLSQMQEILTGDAFNIDRDFMLQPRDQDDPDDLYTNENTLLALDYDSSDVVECLKTLTLSDYSETILDNKADTFQRFFVFGKTIDGHDIYIKVRLKQRASKNGEFVFCISFHFARHPITNFPYR